jgi:hypothetical protein
VKLYEKPTLRLTPTRDAKGNLVYNEHGLIVFRLGLWVGGREIGKIPAVSGQAYNQALLTCRERESGNGGPLGEGVYNLGDSDSHPTRRINWAGGVGNYQASHKPGLGPLWVGIHAHPDYPGNAVALGLHADWNRDAGAPGTIGCVGIDSVPGDVADLKTVAAWFSQYDIAHLVVDYGLGTVPRPATAEPEPKPKPARTAWTKLYANGGRLQAFSGSDEPQAALKVRLDYHSNRLGLAINDKQIPPELVESVRVEIAIRGER